MCDAPNAPMRSSCCARNIEGTIDANPQTYNRAFADILRKMADAIADVKNARVDPEVLVWTHRPGEVTAEVTLSPIA